MRKKYYKAENRKVFYDYEFERCGGRCMICGEKSRLVIDHDHSNGLIRGLLCYTHNTALGMFKDDVEMLKRTITYLEERGKVDPVEIEKKAETHFLGNRSLGVDDLIQEALNNPSFTSDRARAREVSSKSGLSFSNVQTRVCRARRLRRLTASH